MMKPLFIALGFAAISVLAHAQAVVQSGGGTGGGSGTVTSVATGNCLTGGTITTSGTIAQSCLASQALTWLNNVAVVDTGISRGGAGTLDVGNGTQGDISGSLALTNLTLLGTPTFSGIEPGSTQCLQISSAGVLSAAGSACAAAPPSAANPSGTVGLTAVNGSATTYMRSDAAPPLSQSISPTMTGAWTFTGGSNAFGTPASINLTNATAYPATALSGLGTGVGAALGQALNGTGAISASTNPSFTNPSLGTIASGNLANGTGYTLTNVVGAGTAAAANTGTSGATLCLLSANCTVSGVWALGAATATSINGDTLTAGSWTLTGSAGKTLTFSNSLTLAGTDATTMTFPTTSATIARTDAAQTFTGTQTFSTIVPTTVSIANGGQFQINGQPLAKGTTPTITSGFGTSPSITGVSTAAFAVTVGTGGTASTGVITLGSTANHGWSCQAADITTTSAAVSTTKVTANSTTTVTVGNFTDVSASGPWTAGDILLFNCMAY